MSIADHCSPTCCTATPEETVRTAAKRMDEDGVGCLVVVDPSGRPVGMISDRDVVVRVLRRGRDPDATTVGDVMRRDVPSLARDAGLQRAFRRMRAEGLRRLPVIDESGCAVGVFSADDAMRVIANEIGMAAGVAAAQCPALCEGGE